MTKRVRLRLKPTKPVGKKSRGKKQIIKARIPADDETPAESKGDYEIGRGKPPEEGKFKKGDGRKRPGRPPGSKNLATIIMEAARDQITVTIDGKQRKISKVQSGAIQLANAGAMGNPKLLVKFLDYIAAIEARAEAARPSSYPLSDADLKIIKEVHGRLWQYKKRED